MSTVIITEDNFDNEVRNAEIPVLVDFWTQGSKAAAASAKVAESVSTDLSGRFKVATVNVNDAPNLAYRYKVKKVPTMLLFKDGKVTDTLVGDLNRQQLLGILE